MAAEITVAGLSKTYGATQALSDVSLTISSGEFVGLLGSSGSGKSTLLRHMNGLVASNPGSGRVVVGGSIIQDGGEIAADIRAQRARIATVFQQFNLVDRLPVMTNVLAGSLHRPTQLVPTERASYDPCVTTSATTRQSTRLPATQTLRTTG